MRSKTLNLEKNDEINVFKRGPIKSHENQNNINLE